MEDSLLGEIILLMIGGGIAWALKGLIPGWFKKDSDDIEDMLFIGMSVQVAEDIDMGRSGIFVTLHDSKRFRGVNRAGRIVKRGEILTVIDIHGVLPAVGNKKETPQLNKLK